MLWIEGFCGKTFENENKQLQRHMCKSLHFLETKIEGNERYGLYYRDAVLLPEVESWILNADVGDICKMAGCGSECPDLTHIPWAVLICGFDKRDQENTDTDSNKNQKHTYPDIAQTRHNMFDNPILGWRERGTNRGDPEAWLPVFERETSHFAPEYDTYRANHNPLDIVHLASLVKFMPGDLLFGFHTTRFRLLRAIFSNMFHDSFNLHGFMTEKLIPLLADELLTATPDQSTGCTPKVARNLLHLEMNSDLRDFIEATIPKYKDLISASAGQRTYLTDFVHTWVQIPAIHRTRLIRREMKVLSEGQSFCEVLYDRYHDILDARPPPFDGAFTKWVADTIFAQNMVNNCFKRKSKAIALWSLLGSETSNSEHHIFFAIDVTLQESMTNGAVPYAATYVQVRGIVRRTKNTRGARGVTHAELRVLCKYWDEATEEQRRRLHFFYETKKGDPNGLHDPSRCRLSHDDESEGTNAKLWTTDTGQTSRSFWCLDAPPFKRRWRSENVASDDLESKGLGDDDDDDTTWPWNRVTAQRVDDKDSKKVREVRTDSKNSDQLMLRIEGFCGKTFESENTQLQKHICQSVDLFVTETDIGSERLYSRRFVLFTEVEGWILNADVGDICKMAGCGSECPDLTHIPEIVQHVAREMTMIRADSEPSAHGLGDHLRFRQKGRKMAMSLLRSRVRGCTSSGPSHVVQREDDVTHATQADAETKQQENTDTQSGEEKAHAYPDIAQTRHNTFDNPILGWRGRGTNRGDPEAWLPVFERETSPFAPEYATYRESHDSLDAAHLANLVKFMPGDLLFGYSATRFRLLRAIFPNIFDSTSKLRGFMSESEIPLLADEILTAQADVSAGCTQEIANNILRLEMNSDLREFIAQRLPQYKDLISASVGEQTYLLSGKSGTLRVQWEQIPKLDKADLLPRERGKLSRGLSFCEILVHRRHRLGLLQKLDNPAYEPWSDWRRDRMFTGQLENNCFKRKSKAIAIWGLLGSQEENDKHHIFFAIGIKLQKSMMNGAVPYATPYLPPNKIIYRNTKIARGITHAELRALCKYWSQATETQRRRLHFFYETQEGALNGLHDPSRCRLSHDQLEGDIAAAQLWTTGTGQEPRTFWCLDAPPFEKRWPRDAGATWPWNVMTQLPTHGHAKRHPLPCWDLYYPDAR
eukprot:g537.t1